MRRVLALVTGKNIIFTDGISDDGDDAHIENYIENDNENTTHEEDATCRLSVLPDCGSAAGEPAVHCGRRATHSGPQVYRWLPQYRGRGVGGAGLRFLVVGGVAGDGVADTV